MQIAIELIIIFVLLFILIAWAIWKRLTDWINKKRYNPDNDKSRKGEDKRIAAIVIGKSELETREPNFERSNEIPADNIPRPSEPQGRELLPSADADNIAEPERDIGEDQPVSGTAGDSPRRFKLGFATPFKRKK